MLALHLIDASNRPFDDSSDLMTVRYFSDCGAGMYHRFETVCAHTLNPTYSQIDSGTFFVSPLHVNLLLMIYIILPKVMVLSHTNAPIDEWMPDHSIRGHPVRRVIFMGRSAHEEPAIEPRKAMYCFYRDLRVKHTQLFYLGLLYVSESLTGYMQ